MEFFTLDHNKEKRKLKVFSDLPGVNLYLLHESPGIIQKMLDLKFDTKNTIFILSWSWYVDAEKAAKLSKYLIELEGKYGRNKFSVENNVINMANSKQENVRFRAVNPKLTTILSSNCCFLSEKNNKYTASSKEERTTYIMNARPRLFKKHYLTESIKNKVFISYREEDEKKSPQYCDIRNYNPTRIYWDIGINEIGLINSKGIAGLALSDVEGACYASSEYLLSGLPVISTRSFGGRDEFYDGANSIICGETPQSLANAAKKIEEKWADGYFVPEKIRESAIKKMNEHRNNLARAIEKITSISAMKTLDLLKERCQEDNKLYHSRNFWINNLEAG
jgi:hypothetical protein